MHMNKIVLRRRQYISNHPSININWCVVNRFFITNNLGEYDQNIALSKLYQNNLIIYRNKIVEELLKLLSFAFDIFMSLHQVYDGLKFIGSGSKKD